MAGTEKTRLRICGNAQENIGKESERLFALNCRRVLMPFTSAFSQRTVQRMLVILFGAILARGRRNVTSIVCTMGGPATGDCSAFHHVFSRVSCHMRRLGKALVALLIELVPECEVIVQSVDETVAGHKGAELYGKGCRPYAIRSTHSPVTWRWGNRRVVLAVVVKFPFASRPRSLPVLCALYCPRSLNYAEGHRNQTSVGLTRGLVSHLLHWFPGRKFLLVGDGHYSTCDLAAFCHQHWKRLTPTPKFPADTALYNE